MPTITTEVDVYVDLCDFHIDELTDEIENRGFTVVCKDESLEAKERIMDDIHNLYQDFILWKDLGMKNEIFEKILKEFFSEHLDKNVL